MVGFFLQQLDDFNRNGSGKYLNPGLQQMVCFLLRLVQWGGIFEHGGHIVCPYGTSNTTRVECGRIAFIENKKALIRGLFCS